MVSFFYVAIGGFFGSILRSYISAAFAKKPIGTWLANITGSLLLAIVLRLYMETIITETVWLIAGVGFCGAYTTFSTFGNEVLQFILHKNYIWALLYTISSLAIAIAFVAVVLTF